jgi:transposase
MSNKVDTRRLTQEQQEFIRMNAVKRVLAGEKQVDVADSLGVSTWSVNQWVKKARGKGAKALVSKPRGGQKKRFLTKRQENWVIQKLQLEHPEQLKLPFVLWTREAIQSLIENQFGIRLALRTLTDYLERWGMTPQKPVKQAYEQDPCAIEQWLEEDYPQIQAQAKKEKATIYWEDEMGLRSEHYAGRSFSPKGKTPTINLSGKRFGCNMISAITNHGQLAFSIYEKKFTSSVFLDFLKRLIQHNQGKKVIVIVDGHPVHKAKAVKEWLEKHKEEIEMFLLPGYSPELNPDELLNQEIKSTVFSKKRPRDKGDLKALLESKLHSLQKQPEKISAYFKGKYTQYAAS